MAKTFTVIYRTGGTLNAEWHKVLERYTTREAAQAAAVGIEKMGYKTLIHDTATLEWVGMPVGWEA